MSDETWLRECLAEEPLPDDDGFTERVAARLTTLQTPRRKPLDSRALWVVFAAVLSAAVLALGLASHSPPTSQAALNGWSSLALVLGIGLGGLLWLDTEPLRLPDP